MKEISALFWRVYFLIERASKVLYKEDEHYLNFVLWLQYILVSQTNRYLAYKQFN